MIEQYDLEGEVPFSTIQTLLHFFTEETFVAGPLPLIDNQAIGRMIYQNTRHLTTEFLLSMESLLKVPGVKRSLESSDWCDWIVTSDGEDELVPRMLFVCPSCLANPC